MESPAVAPRPLRWGILGCGNIAATVARDLRLVPNQVITAVASAPSVPGRISSFTSACFIVPVS